MGSLSNFEGASEPERVRARKTQLCPTCGQPVPDGGPAAQPEYEPPDQIRVLEERIHDRLSQSFPDFKYHIWLRPLRLLWRERDHLTFTAPEHIRTSFEERYLNVVLRLLREAGWGAVTGEVVAESWRPSPEQLAAGVSGAPAPDPHPQGGPGEDDEPAPKRGPIANAPHRALERTAEALAAEALEAGADETAEMLRESAELARQAQARPAAPSRRRRSDVK